MYPEKERKLTADAAVRDPARATPRAPPLRGKWSDPEVPRTTSTDLNPKLTRTQFADYHGHGWVFRAVYKQDRKGNLLDADEQGGGGRTIPTGSRRRSTSRTSTSRRGCTASDCHFKQDNHGNGKLYGETRAAIEITCVDCHGTINANGRRSRPRARRRPAGRHRPRRCCTTPFGQRRFQWRGDTLIQRSMVDQGPGVGGRAGPRLDRSRLGVGAGQSQARRAVAAGQDAAQGRHDLGRRAGQGRPSWRTPTAG